MRRGVARTRGHADTFDRFVVTSFRQYYYRDVLRRERCTNARRVTNGGDDFARCHHTEFKVGEARGLRQSE